MNPLQVLAAVVLLLAAASTSSASVLEDACKSFAASHTDIGYDFCVKFFQADKGSATADKRGLAVIAARIAGQDAGGVAKHIAALRASAKDKRIVQALSDCAEVYSSAVSQAGTAARGVASGSPAGLQSAVTALSAALDAPDTCEQGFQDLEVSSPLSNEDHAFSKEAAIALAVTSALLR